MMNFKNLFSSLEELEDSAIAFRHGYPMRYTSHGDIIEFTFMCIDLLQECAEKKLMSSNNSVIAWIDDKTLYVIPYGLGNAMDILTAEGYTFGVESRNNFFVPLSNGESLMVDPFKSCYLDSKWKALKATAEAGTNKF